MRLAPGRAMSVNRRPALGEVAQVVVIPGPWLEPRFSSTRKKQRLHDRLSRKIASKYYL